MGVCVVLCVLARGYDLVLARCWQGVGKVVLARCWFDVCSLGYYFSRLCALLQNRQTLSDDVKYDVRCETSSLLITAKKLIILML